MNINDALSLCFKNDIKVYPVIVNGRHKVAAQFQSNPPKVFDKYVAGNELNEALVKTYIHYAKKL
jgi:hypothetical protein